MSLKHGLLGLIDYGPMTGYELCKIFNESLAYFWQATTSQVYRELTAMEKAGWLTSDQVIQTGKPNKKLYTITEAGQRELATWVVQALTPSDVDTRSTFLMKIFFSSVRGRKNAVIHLERFRDIAQENLTVLEASSAIEEYKNEVPHSEPAVYWALTARFGLDYYRMCIAWAEESIKKLLEEEQ